MPPYRTTISQVPEDSPAPHPLTRGPLHSRPLLSWPSQGFLFEIPLLPVKNSTLTNSTGSYGMRISGSQHEHNLEVRSPTNSNFRFTQIALPVWWLMAQQKCLWPAQTGTFALTNGDNQSPKIQPTKTRFWENTIVSPSTANDCELTKQKESQASPSCLSLLLVVAWLKHFSTVFNPTPRPGEKLLKSCRRHY